MKFRIYLFSILTLFVFINSGKDSQPAVTIVPDKPSGVYKTGETVIWTILCNPDSNLENLRYRILEGELHVVFQGDLTPDNHEAKIKYKFTAPGSAVIEVT